MAMLVDEILPFYNDVASEAAILLLQEQLAEAKQAPKKVVKARKLVDSWTGTIRRMAIRLDTLVVALSAERDATTTAAKETFRRRVMSIYSEICDTNDLRTQYPSVDHFANYPLHNLEAHEQVIVVNKNGTEHQKKPHWECCVCKASGQQSLFTSSSLNQVKNHILRQHHRDATFARTQRQTAVVDIEGSSTQLASRQALPKLIRGMVAVGFAQASQTSTSAELASHCVAKTLWTISPPVPVSEIRDARAQGLYALAKLGERFNTCVTPHTRNQNKLSAPTSLHRTNSAKHVQTASAKLNTDLKEYFRTAKSSTLSLACGCESISHHS